MCSGSVSSQHSGGLSFEAFNVALVCVFVCETACFDCVFVEITVFVGVCMPVCVKAYKKKLQWLTDPRSQAQFVCF